MPTICNNFLPFANLNTVATFLLLPSHGNYPLVACLPSYFNNKYKEYFHCKEKKPN